MSRILVPAVLALAFVGVAPSASRAQVVVASPYVPGYVAPVYPAPAFVGPGYRTYSSGFYGYRPAVVGPGVYRPYGYGYGYGYRGYGYRGGYGGFRRGYRW